MEDLRKTGENLIPAIAYGDAAGLPVETWDALKIEETHGWLGRLVATESNPFFAGEHGPGTWSDDTQLSIAVTEALIEADGFDIQAQAEAHIKAFYETPKVPWQNSVIPRGWGGSTTRSVRRLIKGVSPEDSGEKDGSGNGILMKMAPLVYWQVARKSSNEERYLQYDALTRMTHDSEVAIVASRVHGDMLYYLLNSRLEESEIEIVENFSELVLERAYHHEKVTNSTNKDVSEALQFLVNPTIQDDPEKILAATDRKGFYVPQTLAMAYAAYHHLAGDFYHTVYEAVNLGGDTDSTASIVAAMVDFVELGDIELPDDATLLKDQKHLKDVSKRLAQTALNKKGVTS